MNDLNDYLESCLSNTFNNFPKERLASIKFHRDRAIEQAIIDANVKYKGRKEINSQKELLELVQIEPTMEAILLYRLEREMYLRDPDNQLLPFFASLMHRRTGCEIYYSTEIGQGFNIQHGFGIVIGPRYKIGDYFTIHQGVTLGQKNLNSPAEKITVGDHVTIFAGTTLLGNLNIGNNAIIGANSLVLKDVEENSIYVGSPARRIK
jgi:serine O-acetyltransferase